jgi:3-mercaptopyruvate sulfurtransferase SseA
MYSQTAAQTGLMKSGHQDLRYIIGSVVFIHPHVIYEMLTEDRLAKRQGVEVSRPITGIIGLLLVLALIYNADAACSVSGGCGSDSGDWESTAKAFMDSDIPNSFIQSNALKAVVSTKVSNEDNTKSTASSSISNSSATEDVVSPAIPSGRFVNDDMLEPLLGVSSSDIIIDVSNGNQYSKQLHIEGAIRLPSRGFLYENGTLRPISELAKVLGDAGISRKDKVIIYGDGVALSDATFVLWVMRYLGQDDAKVLDGGLDDWIAAGLLLETKMNTRKPVTYEPQIKAELLANYDYVSGGKAQLVDARSFQEFGKKHIPGSVQIDPTQIFDNGRIKDPAQLNDTFSMLAKEKTVVVYSEDGLDASVVWYALQLSGYDSRIYTWKDWLAHLTAQGAKRNATELGISWTSAIDLSKYKKLGR